MKFIKLLFLTVLFSFFSLFVSCNKQHNLENNTLQTGGSSGSINNFCLSDENCAIGTFCSKDNNSCISECIIGTKCGTNKTCSYHGRCLDDINLNLGGFGGEAGSFNATGGRGCIAEKIKFDKQIPTVLFLVDQSGSMNQTFTGSSTNDDSLRRWNILRLTLIDQTTGIIPILQSEVRFGVTLYTGPSGIGNGSTTPSGEQCPILTKTIPTLNNYNNILSIYKVNDWKSETPTGESISAVTKDILDVTEIGQKVIILATDGEPDTCNQPNPQNGQMQSVNAVTDAFSKGILTYVISVGNDVGEKHLLNVANVGQGFPIDDPIQRFYRTNNKQELEDALKKIINGVRSCTFQLNGRVQTGFENKGTVILNNNTLLFNDLNGWILENNDKITILGTSCEMIKSSNNPLIEINFPCGGFKPVVIK